ncbi:MAG: SDR family oxidoreductase [Deltaproteobacteria bacterium]|nr:MAG: SDR family oxidoreductase [Deltaproteobacteria bacterium]
MSAIDPARDRMAVVSGAGTGVGRAIAAKFGALGWRVAIGGRRVDRLAETTELVEKAGGTCFAHALDVTDADSVERFFDAAEAELGKVSAVINNAAVGRYGPLDDFAPSEIAAEIATKLTGSLLMARRGIQTMRAEGSGGDILFISSAAGVQPWPFHLPYAAANAGVEHAARTLRQELEGTGIRVTFLRCGETGGTEFSAREQASGRMFAATDYWFRRGLLRHSGLMTPEIVAEAVATAVTLPMNYQFDAFSVTPTAPIGPLPDTFEEFITQMMRWMAP